MLASWPRSEVLVRMRASAHSRQSMRLYLTQRLDMRTKGGPPPRYLKPCMLLTDKSRKSAAGVSSISAYQYSMAVASDGGGVTSGAGASRSKGIGKGSRDTAHTFRLGHLAWCR